MTRDIVERLRKDDLYDAFNADTLCNEAAEEIEKLRAENERLKAGGCARDQSTTQFCAEGVTLKAENEKLRAALLLARVAVSHACELSDRILYTQDLVRIDAALGEKE